MSRPLQLTQWQQQLASRLPQLPARVVGVLALYSFGVILAQVCGLSAVTLFLGKRLGWSYFPLRKRLSEFYKEASAKSGFRHGSKRLAVEVAPCFAPLLRWVLSLWSGRQLTLALDVTNLGDRFHVLCVCVVVAGVGIPVAWKVLLGGQKEPWNPHWQRLLGHLKEAVADDWTVIVLSDRGLESPYLFRVLKALGWHPLMRVKQGGKFRPKGWSYFYFLGDLVRRPGDTFYAEGIAYTGEQMPCTLLAQWEAGYDEPWLILTDLPPEAADAAWYAMRAWIEQGFKVIKSGGWDWHKTRMEDPARVERLWLVLAVSILWVVAVGAEDEAQEKIAQEQQKQQRLLGDSQEQARQRQEQARRRLEKLREALQARQAQQAAQRKAREEQRKAAKQAKKEKTLRPKETGGQPASGEKRRPTDSQGKKGAGRGRIHGVFVRGLAELRACWEKGQNRLPQHLHPEPWLQPCHPASPLTEDEFLAQQT